MTEAELRVRATVREAIANLRGVKKEIQDVTAASVESARATIEAEARKRETIMLNARAYAEQAATYKKGSAEQVEALRLVQREYGKVGLSSQEAAKLVQDAERSKQTLIARTTAMLRGQSEAAIAAGAAGTAGAGAAEARGERGLLGAATREAGLGRVLGGPALVGGFVAGVGIVESIKLTLQAQQNLVALRLAVRNAGLAWSSYRERVENTIKSQERLSGFSREDLTQTMTTLVQRLGSVSKAQTYLSAAVNFSRGAHISLDTAVRMLTRSAAGTIGRLTAYIPRIKAVTTHMDELKAAHIRVTDANRAQVAQLVKNAKQLDKQATATLVLDTIEKQYHDAAVTRSKTLSGQVDALRNRFRDWAVEVGTRAIPVVTRLLTMLNNGITWIGKQREAWHLLGAAISTMFSGVKTVIQGFELFFNHLSRGQKLLLVLGAAAAGLIPVFFALFAVIAANPFVALAIAAVVAVGVVRKHWAAISKFFENLWTALQARALEFFDWLKMRGVQAALDVVEPFSHLPGRFGAWARKAKKALNDEMDGLRADMAKHGAEAGAAFGQSFLDQVQAYMQAGAALVPAGGQVAGPPAPSGKGAAGAYKPGGTDVVGIAMSSARSPRAAAQDFHLPNERMPYDCSAFTQAVFAQAGIHIGGDTYAQYGGGRKIDRSQIEPGDLIFFNYPGERSPGHVGIYVGGGMMVHDHGQSRGVSYQPVDWAHYVGARCYIKSHVHQATTTTPVAPPSPTTADTSFQGAIDAAAAAAGPPKPKKAPSLGASGVASLRQTVSDLEGTVSKIFPTATRAALEKRAADLMERIHKGIGPAAQAKLRSDLSKLRKDVAAALKLDTGVTAVRESVAKIREQIQGWPARVRGPLQAQVRALSRQLGNVMSPQDLRAAQDRLKALQAAVKKALDAAKAQVAAARNLFEREWSRFSNAALSAFDKVTEATIRTQRVTVQMGGYSFQYGQGVLTPAQQALKDLQDQTAQQQRDQAISDAQSQLAQAQAALAGGATDNTSIADLQSAVTDAQKQLDAAMLDQRESDLQRQADSEQAAADDQFQTWQDAYQATRDSQRQALQDQLDALQANIEAQKDTWSSAMKDISDILAAGGSDAASAFWTAYRAAEQAATGLGNAQAAQAALTGTGGTTDPGQGTRPNDRGGTAGAGTTGFLWGGIVWGPTDKAAFSRWLAQHGSAYSTWASNHPTAAATFLAKGGWVLGGSNTLAMMGEKSGRGEGVIPLDDPRALRAIGDAIAGAMGGGGVNVVIPNATLLGRDRDVAREIARIAAPEIRRQIGYRSPV